jgi:hypothetical protein
MIEGLESAKGRIRSLLGGAVPLRLTPELSFFVDSSSTRGCVSPRRSKTSRRLCDDRARGGSRPGDEDGRSSAMLADYHRVAVELRKAASVVIGSHVKPDGDAIGSALALTLALRDAGIPAVPTLADDADPPPTYSFLPGFGLFVRPDLEQTEAFRRARHAQPRASRPGCAVSPKVRIRRSCCDHHPDNDGFGT